MAASASETGSGASDWSGEERLRRVLAACRTDSGELLSWLNPTTGDDRLNGSWDSGARDLDTPSTTNGFSRHLASDSADISRLLNLRGESTDDIFRFLEANKSTEQLGSDPASRSSRDSSGDAARLLSSRGSNMADLANTLHVAALSSLKAEIEHLRASLATSVAEANSLERRLKACETEATAANKAAESKLESQANRYEQRMTELHGVIFELCKKQERLQGTIIREEDEEDDAASNTSERAASSADEEETAQRTTDSEALLSPEMGCDSPLSPNRCLVSPASPVAVDPYSAQLDQLEEEDVNAQINRVLSKMENAVEQRRPRVQSSSGMSTSSGDDHRMRRLESETAAGCVALETERLETRVSRLEKEAELAELTLSESKATSDRLSLLCAQVESNNASLRLALSSNDQTIAALEALLAVTDAERRLFRAAANGVADGVSRAGVDRKNAEELARIVLNELDCGLGAGTSSVSSAYSSSSTASYDALDEERLKEHVKRLKAERAAANLTLVTVEPIPPPNPAAVLTMPPDLEPMVIMAELAGLKEEKAELRASLYLGEKERAQLELRVNTLESQLKASRLQHEHIKLAQSPTGDESTLRYRARVHELVAALDELSTSADIRAKQSNDFISDLKRANSALMAAYDKAKKKHAARMKKAESQIRQLAERHDNTVRMLKQRIALLEDAEHSKLLPRSETSL